MTDEERAREILTRVIGPQSAYAKASEWWALEQAIGEELGDQRERYEPIVDAAKTVLAFVEFEMRDNPRMRNEPPWKGPLDRLASASFLGLCESLMVNAAS